MNRKSFVPRFLVSLVLFTAVNSGSWCHAQLIGAVPWKGNANGIVEGQEGQFTIMYSGKSSTLGKFDAIGQHTFEPGGLHFSGETIWYLDSGEEIYLIYEATKQSFGASKFAGTMFAVGGTGQYSGIWALANIDGRVRNGNFSINFNGWIHY